MRRKVRVTRTEGGGTATLSLNYNSLGTEQSGLNIGVRLTGDTILVRNVTNNQEITIDAVEFEVDAVTLNEVPSNISDLANVPELVANKILQVSADGNSIILVDAQTGGGTVYTLPRRFYRY